MRRYVFYDRETGRVVHTHAAVGAEGREVEVSPEELAELVGRVVDPRSVSWVLTDVNPISSRVAEQWVDPATGELEVRRVQRPADRAERRRRGSTGQDQEGG
ncbi:hypothetical protein LX15_005934 [Streptoalloteichus tenebrarius]|uniref:DUF2283 domain-containing protein n=1 Tax=Streptoalloteichus tenebrarius (strain ATCC 17920 / DSM 40477 / JCM 4838 / CBS 697.72 / NBRC 16177 / NCIMB 11028 / NRRL B-12390 / A12253. 1 / ISP 5477) TaxID=1933 RepID=A0ABT1I327_STRSD|nr:hypothetical protein [Streptoalloteichus tenebrarius]MCP2262200.1 hypothetical protein [Streptoalloteichus tenebrarius]BFE98962.1 hypothetical protein GCM10020241_06380 [Streptoalloteichus tenebrarius]